MDKEEREGLVLLARMFETAQVFVKGQNGENFNVTDKSKELIARTLRLAAEKVDG